MKLLGLIGYPLGHSFSQDYFRTKFRNEQITGIDYLTFPLENIAELPELIQKHPQLYGLNVTIPYKEKVIPFLDECDDIVRATGAANTLYIERTPAGIKIRGYNTDVKGFETMAEKWQKTPVKRAMVLGTGGASGAVRYVLKKRNTEVLLVSREKRGANIIGYKDLNREIVSSCQLVINTTPLGMFPETDLYPDIPYSRISSAHIVADLIYNPSETLFLKKCRQQGAVIFNGLEMLQAQAEASWRIWEQQQKSLLNG